MTTAAAQAPAPGKLEFKDDYTPDEAERVIRNSKGLPVGVRPKMVWTWKKALLWAAIAIVCACGWAILAVSRGERISAIWFLVVALSSYVIAYRFYAYYIQIKIMRTDDANATPAERVHDGANFERTDRRVLFGQHFAGISGAGPLVGPILAAQMGYLPSTLWIILGVIFAGAVQDMLVLWISAKRRGRSLGQMATDEMGKFGGMILSIFLVVMTAIAMAFLALVAIKAMAASPWAVFSIGMTIPIALIMGCYQRFLRPGRVIETTLLGFVLLVLDIVAGGWIASIPAVAAVFTLDAKQLVIALVIYSFAAAALPHWLLVTPRDYLSTLMKIGTLVLLVIGIIIANPSVKVPGLTELASTSTGPTFSGNLFPFLFITIACGALSGFHGAVSSGLTPKAVEKENQIRMIGYGSMLVESFTAVIALIATALWGGLLWMGVSDANGGINAMVPIFGISNQLLAAACFVLITVCVAKMGYWKHLWIPVVPLVWDIAVTFTADFQKIFGPLSYFTTASKYQAQIDSGELTGEALTNAKAALSNAYLDGVLSVFFLVMMGVFVVVGIVVVARTFAAGKYGAETTSEEPFVESQWFAPSSLVATALEKKVQREYSAKLHELVRNGQVAA